MNIDIVNKQVSKKLNIIETEVAVINKFFWANIKEHIYSYKHLPINIPNVCVFFPTAYHTKKQLFSNIAALRNLRISKRFKPNSVMHHNYMEEIKARIRKIWAIRKTNKYIN